MITAHWTTPDRPTWPLRRLLVTGYRHWDNTEAIRLALGWVWHPDTTLVHGACPTGADNHAHNCWVAWGGGDNIEPHPADWARLGYAAGPERNKNMVNLGADLAFAFLHPASKGTRGCIRLLTAARIPTLVISERADA